MIFRLCRSDSGIVIRFMERLETAFLFFAFKDSLYVKGERETSFPLKKSKIFTKVCLNAEFAGYIYGVK